MEWPWPCSPHWAAERRSEEMPTTRSSAVAIGLALVMTLSACALGQRYQPPVAPVPSQFKESGTTATQVSAIPPIAYSDWWRVFDDPVLARLEQEAVAGNADIRGPTAGADRG